MPDDFTQAKFGWLDRIAADAELGHFAFRVGYVLGSFFNRASGEAWPAQATIADKLGATRRGVQKAMDELERRGHITVQIAHGLGNTNLVRMTAIDQPENADGGSSIEAKKANGGSQQTPGKGEQRFAYTSEKRRTAVPEKVNSGSKKGEPPFTQNSLRELSEELSERYISPDPPRNGGEQVEQDFACWWQSFPRKVSKGTALKAYRAARKKASADELLRGAKRYAGERASQDPKFTKYPATWLNGQCWADEPAPAFNKPSDINDAFDRLDAKLAGDRGGERDPVRH